MISLMLTAQGSTTTCEKVVEYLWHDTKDQ